MYVQIRVEEHTLVFPVMANMMGLLSLSPLRNACHALWGSFRGLVRGISILSSLPFEVFYYFALGL